MKKTILSLLLLCCASVAQQNYPPAFMYFSPATGTGATQAFYFTSWNYSGGAGVQYIWARFGETVHGCNLLFDIPSNRVSLLSDDGTDWGTGAPMGANVLLENGFCRFNASTAYKVVSGAYATGYATIDFKTAFAGAHPTWGWTSNTVGQNSGWIPMNSTGWTVPGAPSPATGISIAPTATSDVTRSFTIQFTDPAGTANVDFIEPVMGGWYGCRPLFYPRWNAVFLLNDAGDNWGTAATVGSTTNLENSKCRVNTNATSFYFINSTLMAVNYSLTAKVGPMGDGTSAVIINGLNGTNTGLVSLGTWTIPMQDQIIGYVKESPATLNPGEVNASRVTLSQAGQNLDTMALRVYHINDPVTFRIRFGRPNQQVWVQRRAMSFVDGSWVNESLCDPWTGISGHEADGACLLGYTDASGFFEWNATILNSLIGMTTAQFYLGSQTPVPDYPTTTFGPMNEDNYIGALVYFVIGAGNYPLPPVW
jgi:hypothetical protein